MEYTIYTDGSCKPKNPGYCGCGIVFTVDGKSVHEISEYLGEGTNNIAELSAVKIALEWLLDEQLDWEEHTIYTDSSYVVGILTKNWKASKNKELIAELRGLFEKFPNTHIEWVRGHNGNSFNELADELANKAVDEGMPNEEE